MLARDLGWSVAELGRRLSAQEFQEWRVIYANEQLHPAVTRLRHAQQLAIALQGPSTRRDRRPWSASDLLAPEPWQDAPEPRRAPMSGAALQRFAAGVNAARAKR